MKELRPSQYFDKSIPDSELSEHEHEVRFHLEALEQDIWETIETMGEGCHEIIKKIMRNGSDHTDSLQNSVLMILRAGGMAINQLVPASLAANGWFYSIDGCTYKFTCYYVTCK